MVGIGMDWDFELVSLTIEILSVLISLPCRQWPLVLCHLPAHPHYSLQMKKRAKAPCLLNFKCTYGHFGIIDAIPRFVVLVGGIWRATTVMMYAKSILSILSGLILCKG